MGKYNGPKDRLSRREGVDLFSAGPKLTRLTTPPGQHGPKGQMGRESQYRRQLREKQKVKRIYGLMEKQFRKYVTAALKSKGNTGEALLSQLETRLDNVVFRVGFAPSRAAARQLVGHRHVLVDGNRVNIPSYQMKVGQTVSISTKAAAIPAVKAVIEDKEHKIPDWLKRKAIIGKVAREPKRDDILEAISESDIVEFYSR